MILQSRFLLRPTPFLPTIPLSFLAAEYKRTKFVGTRGGVEQMRGPRACPPCVPSRLPREDKHKAPTHPHSRPLSLRIPSFAITALRTNATSSTRSNSTPPI